VVMLSRETMWMIVNPTTKFHFSAAAQGCASPGDPQ